MNAQNGFRYAIEILRPDGALVGDEAGTPDFEPAIEALRFAHFRTGLPDPGGEIAVEPQWLAARDPRIDGCVFRSAAKSVRVDRAFFLPNVRRTAARFVETGLLTAGDPYRFNVLCFRAAKTAPQGAGDPADPFAGVQIRHSPGYPCECREAAFEDRLADTTPIGNHHAEDFPVVIPQRVLDETAELTEAAASVETGGLLVGHLWRNPGTGELAAEVTAHLPARLARGENKSLTITPEAWDELDAAFALRRHGETRVGWWHSHPGSKYWCRPECGPEARAQCIFSYNFFSTADASVHRAAFPAAYNIALVTTNTDAGIKFALFGWRDGVVRQRGFFVKDRTREIAEASAKPANAGENNATQCT